MNEKISAVESKAKLKEGSGPNGGNESFRNAISLNHEQQENNLNKAGQIESIGRIFRDTLQTTVQHCPEKPMHLVLYLNISTTASSGG